jgi:hypothetical protein
MTTNIAVEPPGGEGMGRDWARPIDLLPQGQGGPRRRGPGREDLPWASSLTAAIPFGMLVVPSDDAEDQDGEQNAAVCMLV